MPRPGVTTRPRLEALEAREVPALVFWNPKALDPVTGLPNQATTDLNWDVGGLGSSVHHVPVSGGANPDDVVFTALPMGGGDDTGQGPLPVCYNLHGTYNSVLLQEGYLGYLTLDGALTAGALKLASGDIGGADITVVGGPRVDAPATPGSNYSYLASLPAWFWWKAGNISSVAGPLVSNLNIENSGEIDLPTGGTLSCSDTINFTNPTANAALYTLVTGAGTLLLAGNSAGMNVGESAGAVIHVTNTTNIKTNNGAKTLNLATNSYYGFIGSGTGDFDPQVTNNGGEFFLGTNNPRIAGANWRAHATIRLTAGDANVAAYNQQPIRFGDSPTLQIMSGCVLQTASYVYIGGGSVTLTGNSDLAADEQIAMIKGRYEMGGGAIEFSGPIQIGAQKAWVQFKVDGDITWSGGQFNPEINSTSAVTGFNTWKFTGTMTVTTNSLIWPVPQGDVPARLEFDVIQGQGDNAKISRTLGLDPKVRDGWKLEYFIPPGGELKYYGVSLKPPPE